MFSFRTIKCSISCTYSLIHFRLLKLTCYISDLQVYILGISLDIGKNLQNSFVKARKINVRKFILCRIYMFDHRPFPRFPDSFHHRLINRHLVRFPVFIFS